MSANHPKENKQLTLKGEKCQRIKQKKKGQLCQKKNTHAEFQIK